MGSIPYPTEREIRAALIERMKAFCAVTGTAPSTVCRDVINDTTFFSKVVGGGNFTVSTYKKFQAHFDKKWPRTASGRLRYSRRNGAA
jgi:hypothetical protein